MNFGQLKMYIDGELVSSVNNVTKEIYSPLNDERIATLSWADSLDSERALKSAEQGFDTWSKTPVKKRKEWMLLLKDKILEKEEILRKSISYEMGKPYGATAEDIESITNSLKYYSDIVEDYQKDKVIIDPDGTHNHHLVSKPIGVVVAYLAWNFPLLNAGFKLGPALASGCSIILKPSELSPISLYIIGEILHEINFPKGVVNILCGEPSEVATTLSKSTLPKLITMIGSTETAKRVISDSSTSIKKYSMELGGNAPFIVFDDADMDEAVTGALQSKFRNSGQTCICSNRIFVHENIYDEFLEKFTNEVSKITVGNGLEDGIVSGPLIDQSSLEKVIDHVQDAVNTGAKIAIGGDVHSLGGNFYQPTVLSNVSTKAKITFEETFGPVAPLYKFSSDDEVIKMANDTPYGLASYFYSRDIGRIWRVAEALEYGIVSINNGLPTIAEVPFGGVKESGMGREGSRYGLDDYLTIKYISMGGI